MDDKFELPDACRSCPHACDLVLRLIQNELNLTQKQIQKVEDKIKKNMTIRKLDKVIPDEERGKNKMKSDDRVWLETKYLPSLSGVILYVGVNSYTNFYHKLVKTPETFYTIDIDEKRGYHGSPSGHYVGEFQNFTPPEPVDHITLHGIYGYKGFEIHNENIKQDIIHANQILKVGGTLQIGPAWKMLDEFNEKYWRNLYDKFSNYETIDTFKSNSGPGNMIWWGRKNSTRLEL